MTGSKELFLVVLVNQPTCMMHLIIKNGRRLWIVNTMHS